MQMMKTFFRLALLVLITITLGGCAWPNPNIGERTADDLHSLQKYTKELKILKRHAEAGEPWAQLRMGLLYEDGEGIERNYSKALFWYLKTARQESSGRWADGAFYFVFGKTGYYAQNYDAYAAQFRIGKMYEDGKGVNKNLVQAGLWINYPLCKANRDLQIITSEGKGASIKTDLDEIIRTMTDEEKRQFNDLKSTWKPEQSDLYKDNIVENN